MESPLCRHCPFCLVVSMTHPHDPYVTPQTDWDRYTDAGDALAALGVYGLLSVLMSG
ncbi:MAG: hypothetical protein ACHQIL_01260 [Steroidobacterales bacterium]